MIRKKGDDPREPVQEHLDEAQLAFIASGLEPGPEESLHLAGCRICSAVYAELVRARAEFLLGRDSAPSHIVDEGHEFLATRSREAALLLAGEYAARDPHPQPRSGYRGWWAVAPSLALAALVLLMLVRPSFDREPPSAALPELVRQALVEDSAHGMWHPSVIEAEYYDGPALRGPEPASERMEGALDRLQAELKADPDSPRKLARLIAGFQAAGQSRNAREFLNAGLETHPQDEGLQSLAIIQHYREANLLAAELALRSRLLTHPDDEWARLNLAILLCGRGDELGRQEGTALARELSASLGDTGMGRRAQALLP